MSYFDDASLVFIPSGTKTSKAYSVKPIDGTGDLTFSRSNDTATRVNSAGLIEKVRTNLAQRSDAFDNAYWIKSASSVTANATTNPLDGATNADKLVESATTASHFIYNSSLTPAAVNHTYSVYAKAAERTSIQLVSFNGSTDAVGLFNLSTGVVTTQTNGIARIESVGGGWYRCSITHTNAYIASASDYWGQIFLVDGSGNTNYAGNGTSGLFIFGAQFEVSDFGATSYIATTSAAVSVGPVANVPRLDYLNSTCPKLILEPQRSNLAQFSEQADNAAWVKNGVTVTANAATSPDGYTNADKIVETATTGPHGLAPTYSIANSTTYTFSIFAKKAENDYVIMNIYTGVASNFTSFNVANGTIGTTGAGATAKIENYGNGWYRCAITATTAATGSPNIFMWTARANDAIEYTGNGVNGTFIYGCQLEAGAYATSYIPTLGSTSTRAADACIKTGISSLIGQTEGTLFAEFVHNGADILTTQSVISVNSGNTQNFVNIGVYDGQLNPAVQASNASIFDLFAGPNPLPAGTHKVAIAYKSGSFAVYLNGSSVYTNANAATFGTMGQTDIGTFLSFNTQLGEGVKQALLFKTRLPNAQLAELTSL